MQTHTPVDLYQVPFSHTRESGTDDATVIILVGIWLDLINRKDLEPAEGQNGKMIQRPGELFH